MHARLEEAVRWVVAAVSTAAWPARHATHAFDPLLSAGEVERCGATPWAWGSRSDARAVVTQTADPVFARLDPAWLPDHEVVFDGRNSLRDVAYPAHVRVVGVGVPARGARRSPRRRLGGLP